MWSADPENPGIEPNMDALFARYSPLNYTVTLKLGFRVTQGHRQQHYSIEHIRLYIRLPFTRYSRILFENHYPVVFGAPPVLLCVLSVFMFFCCFIFSIVHAAISINLCVCVYLRNDPWWRKTRMMGLSDRKIISMIRSAVHHVCDRRNWRGIYAL